MSRYFFHIRDGLITVPDEEGMECRNIRAVMEEARACARDLAEAALRSRSTKVIETIEVEDERGNLVHRPCRTEWVN